MSDEITIMPGQVWVEKSDEFNPFKDRVKIRIVVEVRDGFVLYDIRTNINDRFQYLHATKIGTFLDLFSLSKTISASDIIGAQTETKQEQEQEKEHEHA